MRKIACPLTYSGHFSMLGLGDIVMPGLLLCFVMRYDAYKRAQVRKEELGASAIFLSKCTE